ncbi:neuronal acetylcholine receptor subunit alpha-7-like [Arctopsyche grandis]|uniref:neuronal acetylcholine receptor subunit alpha-7-like n=1 Tax=Arctopsyche grandis TaxID=121162 RepID=UPI00406D7F7E
METYDAGVRPVEDYSRPLPVTFGVSLHHIIDVDEKNQILTTNCWITQTWTDHHLQWNTSEFAGISVIRMPYQRVWRPDIILYNNADPQYPSSVINTNVIISHTGDVVWLSHGIFRSSCDINVEFFPFDIQMCTLKWASWTYDGYQLELLQQSDQGDMSNYQANGEFDLVSFDAKKHVVFYSCCPEPYPDITYVIKLRRRPMFYVFNLILPCILINGIALLVFYVPSESGEKVTLGISALLSMTVFLMTIRETLPPTEKTPLISLYYGVSICLVSFASALSVVTLNVYHRGVGGSAVPASVRNLVLRKLAKLMFISFEHATGDKNQTQVNPHTGSRLESDGTRIDLDGSVPHNTSPKFFLRRNSTDNDDPHCAYAERCGLRRLTAAVERDEKRRIRNDKRESSALEWRQVAFVLDRALLAAFLVATALATAAILCGAHPPDTEPT